ncbi:lipopolysaccharide biosynthesis protein [Nocardioides bruguierae]|uniref:Polysaccharide biosynthesis protein n=1 Tax=Nocardioides bruguierae TaxID=2945102 RepID=A0A9X2IHT5_9ACTN|nr:polysaccharide biosynthesis protein [Nocardioides bruguierae]MCM0622135.1 polysaccharide biosynthesis protein [Nocardioides bruguierae]
MTSAPAPAPAQDAPPRGRLRGVLGTSAGIAVAMGVMNVATYGFQMVSARLLGPTEYGAVASLMALLMVVAVAQLGLQATAARRVSTDPAAVHLIERDVLGVTYRAAWAVGALMLVLAPVVHRLLHLDSIWPALLVAAAAVPLTISGGQAGVLQGERRWLALSMLYLGIGVPRLVLGVLALLVMPSETSAMVGVALAMLAPAIVGWVALRPRAGSAARGAASSADGAAPVRPGRRPVAREALAASLALLAFFLLSNVDIVLARNLLPRHQAGLYAAGLILTKAVLFLPQFVVVVAFPSMSTAHERRRALLRSLAAVLGIGAVSTLAAWLLAPVALVFVGGAEYADVQDELWLFAVLGTLLSMLQLLVYSVLARRGRRSQLLVWGGVLALVGLGATTASLPGLVAVVIAVDALLLLVLLGLSLHRLGADEPADPTQSQTQGQTQGQPHGQGTETD